MLLIMMMTMFLIGVISFGIRLAWGTTKFLFGLGLFFFCPVILVLAILFGAFSHLWLPILLIGLLCSKRFRVSV